MERRSFVLAVALVTLTAPGAAAKGVKPLGALPLRIAVAQEEGRPVRDDAWIDAQVAEAERLFGPIGVHFRKASTATLDARYARLETRKDRDALAAELHKGVINVMIVASLRDVDDPSLYRMGVHWRPSTALKKHYVIVAASAQPSTLAHELGHFFGLAHTAVPNNLMSYARTGDAVFLDAAQASRTLAFARLSVAAKEVVPDAGASVVTH
jgi:hypothetical protein